MTSENQVKGYFNRNNYKYLEETKNKLEEEGIKASKSKILELGVVQLRKMEYKEIKENIGDLV